MPPMRAVVCLAALLLLTATGCSSQSEPKVVRDIEKEVRTLPPSAQVDPPGGTMMDVEEDMEPESDPDDNM